MNIVLRLMVMAIVCLVYAVLNPNAPDWSIYLMGFLTLVLIGGLVIEDKLRGLK